MSEILLKNIEFPKEGTLTLLITSNGEVYRIPRKYCRNDTVVVTVSKAVKLPPHGDLIDRSKLSVIPITDYKLEGHLVVEIEDIENAPTILEASK